MKLGYEWECDTASGSLRISSHLFKPKTGTQILIHQPNQFSISSDSGSPLQEDLDPDIPCASAPVLLRRLRLWADLLDELQQVGRGDALTRLRTLPGEKCTKLCTQSIEASRTPMSPTSPTSMAGGACQERSDWPLRSILLEELPLLAAGS